MAIELADIIPFLKAELDPVGQGPYANITNAMYETILANAFWHARINGLLTGYQEIDGTITPISGTTDLGRDQQQIIILYAAYNTILANFQNLKSQYRAKAGPVEIETAQQATVLKTVLDALRDRMKLIIATSEAFGSTDVAVFDAYLQRTESISYGEAVWVR